MSRPEQIQQTVKAVGDLASVSVVVGTLMTWLPPVAAFLTIIWTGIRIYETDTIQRLIRRKKGGEGSEQ